MDTIQVQEYLTKDKYTRKIFGGVIPIDHLPKNYVSRPKAYIINSGDSTTPGEHWFAVFIPKRGPIEYFDSYGLKPINKEIYNFVKLNRKSFIHNPYRIQANDSYNCGKYSLFYLYLRSRGYTMRKILQFFIRHKLNTNDLIVNSIFNKIKNKIFKN